ncbi:MAG: sel1 repeat family protein [Deltaproteobacteria bacterium]|nr:sel1 repeat family protein [Deltaproteobacteria bacterium]MBW2218482.1 sel1 repeat family protein [Deltaproteobacteria bacterium]
MIKKSFLHLVLLFSCILVFTGAAFSEGIDLEGLLEKAKQGDVKAQSVVGFMYRKGDSVPQNYAEAFKWFTKAAGHGGRFAQYNLGIMYENGEGVPQNYAKAVKWYIKAAKQGLAEAQYTLGNMYANGKGIQNNYKKAYIWFSLASAQGDEKAKHNISIIESKMTSAQITEAQKETAELWKKIAKE